MKKLILLIAFIALMLFNTAEASQPKITYEKMIANSTVAPPFIIYSRLKDECYAQDVPNKEQCIRIWLAIAKAECSWKDTWTPFWLQSEDKSYKKWVSSFKKYWYKANHMSFFYWANGKAWPSHYCLSEYSSNTEGWCPNWAISSQIVYESLHFWN